MSESDIVRQIYALIPFSENMTVAGIKRLWMELKDIGMFPASECNVRAKRDEDRYMFWVNIEQFMRDMKVSRSSSWWLITLVVGWVLVVCWWLVVGWVVGYWCRGGGGIMCCVVVLWC